MRSPEAAALRDEEGYVQISAAMKGCADLKYILGGDQSKLQVDPYGSLHHDPLKGIAPIRRPQNTSASGSLDAA